MLGSPRLPCSERSSSSNFASPMQFVLVASRASFQNYTLRSAQSFTNSPAISVAGYIDCHSHQKSFIMFASHHLPPVVSVNRSWSQRPTLTTSEVDQHRFEDHLFSPASPAGAQLHRNRIEELLWSPTSLIDELICLPDSRVDVHALPNPKTRIAFAPPSPAKEIMPPQDRTFYIPPPNPRFFEELHSERTYLLDCLQIQNRKATELLRSIPPLEERLIQNNSPSFERKRIRKRLGWLRQKLVETNRQEKRVLARLGQLTLEIQTRERWTQIDFERRQGEVERYHTRYGIHRSRLNPESAVFQPEGSQLP